MKIPSLLILTKEGNNIYQHFEVKETNAHLGLLK